MALKIISITKKPIESSFDDWFPEDGRVILKPNEVVILTSTPGTTPRPYWYTNVDGYAFIIHRNETTWLAALHLFQHFAHDPKYKPIAHFLYYAICPNTGDDNLTYPTKTGYHYKGELRKRRKNQPGDFPYSGNLALQQHMAGFGYTETHPALPQRIHNNYQVIAPYPQTDLQKTIYTLIIHLLSKIP